MVGGKKINPVSEVQQSLCYVNTFSELLRRKEKELLPSDLSDLARPASVSLRVYSYLRTCTQNWSTDWAPLNKTG